MTGIRLHNMAYIMIQHDGKNIGLYDTDRNVYIKHGIKKSKHFFKKLKAWGVDSVTFRNILKPEARIVIEEVEERKRYETDKKIELIWEDADRAHDVEIKWGKVGGSTKTKKTADDGDWSFKDLKNGVAYSFKVRGISNCGKSSWTDGKNTSLPGKPNRFLP